MNQWDRYIKKLLRIRGKSPPVLNESGHRHASVANVLIVAFSQGKPNYTQDELLVTFS